MKDPAEDEIEAAGRCTCECTAKGCTDILYAALRQSQARASSLEGRLEAAMKVVEAAKIIVADIDGDADGCYDVGHLKNLRTALDETGGRA